MSRWSVDASVDVDLDDTQDAGAIKFSLLAGDDTMSIAYPLRLMVDRHIADEKVPDGIRLDSVTLDLTTVEFHDLVTAID
ncbi:MAG: hypothetical protein ACXABY_36395, partial [Candidatus Thorarchaeota archaeon]